MKNLLLALLFLIVAPAASAYHLELEVQPAAAFPYLAKFGTIDLHVYDDGIRADTVWLDGFSRNGSPSVTVLNPLARMYTEVPIAQISSILGRLGTLGSIERQAAPTVGPKSQGKVSGVAATRHRLVFGPTAYIDYWTTTAIPENPQLRRIVHELVSAISPGTAEVAKGIGGTPVYVELNFRRFQKVPLVRLRKLSSGAGDGAEMLAVGSFYVRAPLLEALWK